MNMAELLICDIMKKSFTSLTMEYSQSLHEKHLFEQLERKAQRDISWEKNDSGK